MQMLCCCERVGPIHGCFTMLMALLLRRTLQHQCCLGPLACRCFAAVSVLDHSTDALPRRWFSLLGWCFAGCSGCFATVRPPFMKMLCCCERVGPIRRRFVTSMVLLLRQMLRRRCCLGPLIRRCFAVVSALAPSADALPCRWVFVASVDALLPRVSSGCFAVVIFCAFTSLLATLV